MNIGRENGPRFLVSETGPVLYVIPVFSRLTELPKGVRGGQQPRRSTARIPDFVVEAVKWDYQHELLSLKVLQAKYAPALTRSNLRNICYGHTRKGIVAVKHDVSAWLASVAAEQHGRAKCCAGATKLPNK